MTTIATVAGHFPLTLVHGPGRRRTQLDRHRAGGRHGHRHALHAVRGALGVRAGGPRSPQRTHAPGSTRRPHRRTGGRITRAGRQSAAAGGLSLRAGRSGSQTGQLEPLDAGAIDDVGRIAVTRGGNRRAHHRGAHGVHQRGAERAGTVRRTQGRACRRALRGAIRGRPPFGGACLLVRPGHPRRRGRLRRAGRRQDSAAFLPHRSRRAGRGQRSHCGGCRIIGKCRRHSFRQRLDVREARRRHAETGGGGLLSLGRSAGAGPVAASQHAAHRNHQQDGRPGRKHRAGPVSRRRQRLAKLRDPPPLAESRGGRVQA